MEKKIIDVKGKPCPTPVIMTKKALEEIEEGELEILIDSEVSFENVSRFIRSQGLEFASKKQGDTYIINIIKGKRTKKNDKSKNISKVQEDKVDRCIIPSREYVIYVSNDKMGEGDEKLGEILLISFFKTLVDASPLPSKILFVNKGVFVTTEGSKLIDTLKKLEEAGVNILSCGTCLDFYNLKDKLKVGNVTNMFEILESLKNTGKVIKL